MKKLYSLLFMALCALQCLAAIVTERPAGNLVYYQRSSGLTYFTDGGSLRLQNQAGFTEIVFSTDGTKAWIKNPVASFFPEGENEECAYIVGTVGNNGSTITVDMGQEVYYDENAGAAIKIAMLKKDVNSGSTNYVIDRTAAQAVYAVNGNTVTLQGTSKDMIFGLVYADDSSWTGFGDYETIYTVYDLPEEVTPPAGLTPKAYPVSAIEHMNEEDSFYNGSVNVVMDGNDVYIQGLDKFIPWAWVKGERQGTKVTFPVQYIGTDPAERRNFLTGWNQGAVGPVTINYYEDVDAFESVKPFTINSNPTMINYYVYYQSMFIGNRFPEVELPEGANTTKMTITGYNTNTGLGFSKFRREARIARVGNDVYIQGISEVLPEKWSRGTLEGNVLSIPQGQYVGFSPTGAIYLHGQDNAGNFDDIKFTYDPDENSYTTTNSFYECSAYIPQSYSYLYQAGVKIYFDPNAPSGADPEDLPHMAYTFAGNGYDYVAMKKAEFSHEVKVALDGNLVYIKGFDPAFPDAWIKGEIDANVVEFATPQPLGFDGTDNIVFHGYDMMMWELKPTVTMSYNPTDESYTLTSDAITNKNATSINYKFWYQKNAKLTKGSAGIADVTVEGGAGADEAVYNLQGIRVSGDLVPGQVYIAKGRKFIAQ